MKDRNKLAVGLTVFALLVIVCLVIQGCPEVESSEEDFIISQVITDADTIKNYTVDKMEALDLKCATSGDMMICEHDWSEDHWDCSKQCAVGSGVFNIQCWDVCVMGNKIFKELDERWINEN